MTTLGTADLTLTIAVQTALAPPWGNQWLITKATATNSDSVARTVTVYRVPATGTAAAGNIVVEPMTLQPSETVALPLSAQALVNGATLQASASADNVVNLNITYQVVT